MIIVIDIRWAPPTPPSPPTLEDKRRRLAILERQVAAFSNGSLVNIPPHVRLEIEALRRELEESDDT